MDSGQQRVADVVRTRRQAEQKVIALALAFDADKPCVGNQRQQWPVITDRVGSVELLANRMRNHAPPSFRPLPKRIPPLISCPRRMNVPTTWQMGWSGLS